MSFTVERKTRDKNYTTQNVLDAALERIRYLYKNFDTVSVAFSGGKDSTACLHLTLQIARELGRLPVRACFFDEEAIHPPTIEYVERVRQMPDVMLEWYCLPFRHRNACSNEQPWWECWDPAQRELWVRPMPECAISEHPGFVPNMTVTDFAVAIRGRNECQILGIRTQESLRRFRMMTMKRNENYIARGGSNASAYPIYDWNSVDVWRLVREGGFDYNQTYDILNRTRLHENFLAQRVCPPFGDEPLRGLWKYAECWPEFWHRMLNRVPGVNTAWRYANTELYCKPVKPDEMTWREYMELLIENWECDRTQIAIREKIDMLVRKHYDRTVFEIEETRTHPLTGVSWKFLAMIASKGDLKGRQSGMATSEAKNECTRLGIDLQTSVDHYGKTPFQFPRPPDELDPNFRRKNNLPELLTA